MSTTAYKITVMKAFEDGATIERMKRQPAGGFEYDLNPAWNWEDSHYRIKPPERKTVKLLAWFDGNYLFWAVEGGVEGCPKCGTRVPAEDKTIEIE